MANINGLPVNSAVVHAEFMSRTEDTSTVAKISLNNTSDVNSGATIANVQRAINKAFEAVGINNEADTGVNTYNTNNFITNGDSKKEAIEALDLQLGLTQTQLDNIDSGNTQDVTLASIGSTPNANGASLAGQVLNLEPASASFGGVVTTGTQTFAGNKTFQNNVIINGDFTVNGTPTNVNSTDLNVTDKNIFINVGGNDASSEGAGITVDRSTTDASLVFENALASKWKAGLVGSEIELANVSSSQTFTNKTLTSPVINSPTGLVKADVGLSNVDNTSDATKNSATATLTNKTINGFNNTITNVSLLTDVTGTLLIGNGGTGQTTQTAAFDALAPTTTKGDLIVNDGTDNIRVGVGANGTVLIADSAEASGVKWSNISAKYARYYLSTTQSITDNTNTTIVWNVEQVNAIQSGMMNTSTGRLTLGRAGVLRCTCSFGIVSSVAIVSGNRTALYLRKNGGSLLKIAGDTFEGSVTETKQSQGTDLLFFDNATDYYDFICYLDFGGGPYNLGSVNTGVTYLTLDEL